MLTATKRQLAVMGLAAAGLGVCTGCGAKDLDPPPLPEIPPLVAPPARAAPVPAAEASHLAEQRQSEAVITIAACLRRSQSRIEHAWTRLLVDLDPESGALQRERKGVQPWIPAVRGDLVACPSAGALETEGVETTLVTRFAEYLALAGRLSDEFERLAAYFDERRFEADDWSLSRELVPNVTQVHAEWRTSAEALVDVLRPARLAAIDTLLQGTSDVSPDHPSRLALALLRASYQLEDCLAGAELGRCTAVREALPRPLAQLEAWLAANPDAAAIPFWARAQLKAGRELERVLLQTEASMRKGRLLPPQRQALDDVRIRLENAAETVWRDLATEARPPR